MNTKRIAVATTLGTFAVLALMLAYPAMAATVANQAAPTATPQQILANPNKAVPQKIDLSTGQTITLTSVAGGWHEVGNPSVNGTATGTLTLEVTGAFSRGYALSITGGSFSINNTTYTVSSGSAEMGPYGFHMVGQGQAGTASFLFGFRDIGKFGSTNYAIVGVDLKAGSSEYFARLLVTVNLS
jgi:hypothetical protein